VHVQGRATVQHTKRSSCISFGIFTSISGIIIIQKNMKKKSDCKPGLVHEVLGHCILAMAQGLHVRLSPFPNQGSTECTGKCRGPKSAFLSNIRRHNEYFGFAILSVGVTGQVPTSLRCVQIPGTLCYRGCDKLKHSFS